MKIKFLLNCYCALLLVITPPGAKKATLSFCGSIDNDLYVVLKKENVSLKHFADPEAAIMAAANGTGVFIIADGYPGKTVNIKPGSLQLAAKKKLRLYIEYPASLPGLNIPDTIVKTNLERGVITSDVFGKELARMSLLGINDAHILAVDVKSPLIVLGKVAGYNKAEYGIEDVKTYPYYFKRIICWWR